MIGISLFNPGFLPALMAISILVGCTAGMDSGGSKQGYQKPQVRHEQRIIPYAEFADRLGSARAILVGETHDRLDHHLNQLEIIRHLHESGVRLAIGMEAFQQPFQPRLDAYIAGRIDVTELLQSTEYYERWQYDFRLYEPILDYARRHRIPVLALNPPRELTEQVSRDGLDRLDDLFAAQLPEIDRSDDTYRDRLRAVFEEHSMAGHGPSFEAFYGVQLVWDEGMAAAAADYLARHPERSMVIIAGRGHIDYGSGIPHRLARRLNGEVLTVTHVDEEDDAHERADYLLQSEAVHLPRRGLLGVLVESGDGAARIASMSDDSAAGAVGMQADDVIVALDRQKVERFADLRAMLWDKRPGDQVSVTVRRNTDQTLDFDVVLR